MIQGTVEYFNSEIKENLKEKFGIPEFEMPRGVEVEGRKIREVFCFGILLVLFTTISIMAIIVFYFEFIIESITVVLSIISVWCLGKKFGLLKMSRTIILFIWLACIFNLLVPILFIL